METLEIRITSMYPSSKEGGIRTYATATIDGCLGIRRIKVVEGGRDGLFVSMPSRKTVIGKSVSPQPMNFDRNSMRLY